MRVLGISAGNGVCLFPFKKYLIANIEIRPIFHTRLEEQWVINFPKVPLYRELLPKKELKGIDMIISHPDCGHSSALRLSRAKKNISAKDNKSLNITIEGINLYKSKTFLLENLPGLLKTYSKADFKSVFPNYKLYFIEKSVSEFGNSQKSRIRLVIIGIRLDIWNKRCKVFKKPRLMGNLGTIDRLIGDLSLDNPKTGHIREADNTKVCMNYKGNKQTLGQIRDLWNNDFKDFKKWPVNNGRMKFLPGVYRDKDGTFPSTVRKQNRAFGPSGSNLTPRECARIQGIPDEFKIHIDKEQLGYWLNKSRATVTKCPPYQISLWYKQMINKSKILK